MDLFNRYVRFQSLRMLFSVVCLLWAISMSLAYFTKRAKIILIGIDEAGARLIVDEKDKLFEKERLNFLKRYVSLLYSYDSESYSRSISDAGSLMSDRLWKEKETEFRGIADKITKFNRVIHQRAAIKDIRALDDRNFEIPITIEIESGLTNSSHRLLLKVSLKSHARTEDNPWMWEVDQWSEEELH